MLVILHGWSDSYQSFVRLGKRLVADGVRPDVRHVRLGDYVSLDDDVTFDDLTQALQAAWKRQKLPTAPGSVDVVVHSTGGLVVRHWMTTFFTPATNPIKRLLMLAPANFGSPLAHKGRSFMGRIVKGFKSDKLFNTGTHILKGLELASPFSWELAQRDCFGSDVWYGPGGVLCTVLVGAAGYSGISAAANEDGTDGTVRVSTANLNPVQIRFDFSTDPAKPTLVLQEAKGKTAFARLPDDNHSTIALKDNGPRNPSALGFIKEALQVTDSGFADFAARLEDFSAAARKDGAIDSYTQGYQNTVVRLTDSQGAFVPDFFLEVFAKDKAGVKVDDRLTRVVQEAVFGKVHAYGDNAAYRSLMFNTTVLHDRFVAAGLPLYVSVTAMPDVSKTRTVGYATFGYDDIGSIKLTPDRLRKLFQPDRTVLIDMKIKRQQTDKVFRMMGLG
ncbi:MAG: alpha/beta fold hydrolase [Pseudomonadota bacterium]